MAVISINLDDQASVGLKDLVDALNRAAQSTDDLSKASDDLTEEQQQQITVIQRQSQDWKSFTSQMTTATIPALRDFTVKALDVTLELEQMAHAGTEFSLKAGLKVVDTLADMAVMGLKYTLITKGAVEVISAMRGKTEESNAALEKHGSSLIGAAAKATALGVAVTTLTGQWDSLEQAGGSAAGALAKNLLGVGAVAAGVTAGFAAWQTVMANTGKRADELGNITTNLDRISIAAAGLRDDIAGVGTELASNFKSAAMAAIPLVSVLSTELPRAWKEIDAAATRTADIQIQNINLLRDMINGTREFAEANSKLEAQRSKEKAGFEAIRNVNQQLAEQEKARARSAEIASIQTVAGIEEEIQATRRRASADAQAGRDSQQIQRNLLADLTALEQQRTKLHDAELAKQKAADDRHSSYRKQIEAQQTEYQQDQIEKRVKATQDAYDRQKKIDQDYFAFVRNLQTDARQSSLDDIESILKAKGEEDKARAESLAGDAKTAAVKKAQRDTDDALHALKLRRIQEELNAAVNAAKSEEEAQNAIYEAIRKRNAAEAEFRRKQVVEQIQDRTAAAQRELAIEQEKQAKLKAIAQQGLEKGGLNPQDLLKSADPRNVLKLLQDQARQRAKQQFGADNRDLWSEAETDSTGPARRKYDAMQKRAQDEAARQAAKDFARGNTDPQQLANAQAQVAGKQLQALNAAGKITDTGLQATTQLLQATANLSAQQQAQQRQIDQIARDAATVNAGIQARQQRSRAQQGSQ